MPRSDSRLTRVDGVGKGTASPGLCTVERDVHVFRVKNFLSAFPGSEDEDGEPGALLRFTNLHGDDSYLRKKDKMRRVSSELTEVAPGRFPIP